MSIYLTPFRSRDAQETNKQRCQADHMAHIRDSLALNRNTRRLFNLHNLPHGEAAPKFGVDTNLLSAIVRATATDTRSPQRDAKETFETPTGEKGKKQNKSGNKRRARSFQRVHYDNKRYFSNVLVIVPSSRGRLPKAENSFSLGLAEVRVGRQHP